MENSNPREPLLNLLERFVAAHERIAEAAERVADRSEVEAASGSRKAGKAGRRQRIRPPEEPVSELDQARAKQAMRRNGMR